MEINSSGIKKTDLTEYLGFWTNKLREVYGDNFVIRKEGVIDNLATSGSLTCMALEDVLMYFAKQFNPYTAEGEWQDSLFSLVGLIRNYATFTVVTRTIEGVANTVCEKGSIRFKNTATEDIFELNTTVVLDGNGKGVGSFTAIELGSIDLENTATLEIIDAPTGVVGVYYEEGNVTNIGDDYEDDSEFRNRWLVTNSVKTDSKTEGGMYAALLPYCNNSLKNLKIRQNRAVQEYIDFPKHTMHIIVKSGESNETIANVIFNNLTDGVGLYGGIEVTVKDVSDTDVIIAFDRAEGVPIYFNVEVVLKSGYAIVPTVDIQNAIINNFDYAMGERIVANDFYQYINAVDGIDYVTTLEISLDNENFAPTLVMNYDEYGTVKATDITVGV